MADVTYYFNARHASEVWTDPDQAVDNNLETFASTTVNNEVQRLITNTCPGTNLGTITKVEIRAYAKGDGNDELYLRPEFTGGTGNNHITVPVVAPGAWVGYQDITNDPNAPDWSLWSHIQDLDCDIELDDTGKGNTMYCAKVEVRVTYTPEPTVTTQAVTDILTTTATGHGTIVSVGVENASKRGVCWNTTGNPTVADDKSEETDSFGAGAFSRAMTGLVPSTHYYVKAYAYNSAGYGYGNEVEFDTAWVPPESDIDVGAEPIDREYDKGSGYTYVDKYNPANASGTLHSVKVYALINITGFRVGTFYVVSGDTLKCRDSEVIGDVTAGAERTFTELSIDVQEGDYIGCYFTAGNIESDIAGYERVWRVTGEYIDPDDEATYGFFTGHAISLYGYGDIEEFQELTASPVATSSSVQNGAISGSGNAPLTGTFTQVASSVQASVIAGTGIAPLTGTFVQVTSSVVTGTIENVAAEQELTAAPVAVASSVQSASISGSGNAPLTGVVVSVASSVQVATIAGSGNAPLSATVVAVASSISQASIGFAKQYLASSPVQVVSSVSQASISGSGIAPLTGTVVGVASSVSQASISLAQVLSATVVAVASSVQQAVLTAEGEAPLTASPVTVASSIQATSIAGSGNAPLTASSIGVASSVQQASIFIVQTLSASPIAVTSSVQTASIAGIGIANLAASSVGIASSVVTASVVITPQILVASPVTVASSVVVAGVSGSGEAPLAVSPIPATSSIQQASISGVADLVADVVAVASSVVASTIENVSAVQELTASPVSVASSVQAASVSGFGDAPLATSPVSVASGIQNASISGIGAVELVAATIAVVASIRNTALAAVGAATLTSAPIQVTSSIVAGTIVGTEIAPLFALPVNVSAIVQNASISKIVVLTYEEYATLQTRILELELALKPKAHFRI